jgi:hypothetical protein
MGTGRWERSGLLGTDLRGGVSCVGWQNMGRSNVLRMLRYHHRRRELRRHHHFLHHGHLLHRKLFHHSFLCSYLLQRFAGDGFEGALGWKELPVTRR